MGDRQPVERTERLARGHRGVGFLRLAEQLLLRKQRHDGVQARVDLPDPREANLHHLHRGDLAPGDQASQLDRRRRAEAGHLHGGG